jgi:germination protein M
MTRRAAAGIGRLLPLLVIAAAVVIVAGAALLAACGGSTGGATSGPTATVAPTAPASGTVEPNGTSSASPTAAATTTLRLYFLREGKLGVAERQVAHTTMPATASLKALLAGPKGGEPAAGLTTAIRAGTKLLDFSIASGVAHVDLSDDFAAEDSEEAAAQRTAEVVYTLTRFPTVRRVALTVGGRPYAAAGIGTSPSAELSRSDFRDLEPNIFVETPGVGADLSSPFTFSGTASVNEGTVLARLVDSSGRRIVEFVTTASRGAPGRGRFSKVVPFSTSASSGTLTVFDQSMEDGSRLDEVKIPVSFATD